MRRWNGYSAVTDLTSPRGREWFTGQLRRVVGAYGVDGFKLVGPASLEVRTPLERLPWLRRAGA